MRLNGHVVVKDLDIFDRVGHSTAHDEIVPFSIRRGKLSVQGEVSTFNSKLTVEFVKVPFLLFSSSFPPLTHTAVFQDPVTRMWFDDSDYQEHKPLIAVI